MAARGRGAYSKYGQSKKNQMPSSLKLFGHELRHFTERVIVWISVKFVKISFIA